MSRDGLTLEQTGICPTPGYLAAYMPDHASKSRFIIPGVKGFTKKMPIGLAVEPRASYVPYMLRLSPRETALSGDLIADLTPKLTGEESCSGPVDCMQAFSNHVADRALAGLNRVMEQGVEPLARMIWAPTSPSKPRPETSPDQNPNSDRAPLREPPITADPLVLREQPRPIEAEPNRRDDALIPVDPDPFIPLPPDLPPPVLLENPVLDAPASIEPRPGTADQPDQAHLADLFEGAPPPPELPPLPSPRHCQELLLTRSISWI